MKYSGAVAVVEVAGLPTAIACADAMLKSANVTLIGYEITKGGPGMVNVKICGDVGAVQAAVDAGCAVANRITRVVSRVIMPRPHDDLEKILLNRNEEAYYASGFATDGGLSDAEENPEPAIIEEASAVREGAKTQAEVKPEEGPKTQKEIKAEEEAKAQNEVKPEEVTKSKVEDKESKAKDESKAKGGDKQSKSKEEARSDSKSKSAPIEKKTPKNPKKEPGKK